MLTRHASWGLGFLVAFCAAVLVGLGLRQSVGYDSMWHVFIARQETWALLWEEIGANAHPPLFYLALRGATALCGDSALAVRAVSILSVLAALPLLASVVGRLTRSPAVGLLAAAAYGLSADVADLALEVRAYALALTLMLGAFAAWLRWWGTNPRRLGPWPRALFASATSAALVTHYAAFFFLAGAMVAPALSALLHRRWRRRAGAERRHLRALAVMFGVPLAVGAAAYGLHARHWRGRFAHLPTFLFDASTERRGAFVARAVKNLAVLFVPDTGSSGLGLAFAAVVALGAVVLLVRRASRGHPAVLPLLLLAAMLALNAAAGLAGRYPFGGALRHAMFLFPFALVSLFVVSDGLRRLAPNPSSSRAAWGALAALAVAGNFAHWRQAFVFEPPLLEPQMKAFRQGFGTRGPVLVDEFNFIVLYLHHHDWAWHSRWRERGRNMYQLWDVSRGTERFQVCRSSQWLLDEGSMGTYAELLECLDRTGAAEGTVFRPEQPEVPATGYGERAPAYAHDAAAAVGLVMEKVGGHGTDFFASFRREAEGPDDPPARIVVVEATYGGNCVPGAHGNGTVALREACDGRDRCAFRVDVAALGDPLPGCEKDFHAQWRCGAEGELLHIAVPPEAGHGGTAYLRCRH